MGVHARLLAALAHVDDTNRRLVRRGRPRLREGGVWLRPCGALVGITPVEGVIACRIVFFVIAAAGEPATVGGNRRVVVPISLPEATSATALCKTRTSRECRRVSRTAHLAAPGACLLHARRWPPPATHAAISSLQARRH